MKRETANVKHAEIAEDKQSMLNTQCSREERGFGRIQGMEWIKPKRILNILFRNSLGKVNREPANVKDAEIAEGKQSMLNTQCSREEKGFGRIKGMEWIEAKRILNILFRSSLGKVKREPVNVKHAEIAEDKQSMLNVQFSINLLMYSLEH